MENRDSKENLKTIIQKQIKPSSIEDKPINALPDYEVRTMKDDLAELGLKNLEKEAKTPWSLPEHEKNILPTFTPILPKKSPLPGTEELIAPKKEELPPPPKPKPLPPLPQIEELKIPEPSYTATDTASTGKRRLRLLILVVVLILIAGGVTAFIVSRNGSQTPAPQPPQVSIPEPSAQLIFLDETKIISLISEKPLFELIKEEAKSEQPTKTFKRMAILKNEEEFLSLTEIFQNLEISISPFILSGIEGNHNLFLYNQENGKRLGLIVEIQNAATINEQFGTWEQTMLDDFKNFYPTQVPGQRASKTFLDDVHQGISIRYVNLPKSDLTLNYAFVNNLLIIGTSKELIYTVIDKILGIK